MMLFVAFEFIFLVDTGRMIQFFTLCLYSDRMFAGPILLLLLMTCPSANSNMKLHNSLSNVKIEELLL